MCVLFCVVGRGFKWGCRAASPLAAVAVCGSGKVCGRDKSLPYELNRERDLAVSCGPGMPGPYRAAMGKRDVAESWRAAYMRPLQGDKKFIPAGVRGKPRLKSGGRFGGVKNGQ